MLQQNFYQPSYQREGKETGTLILPDTRVFCDVRWIDLCVFVGVDHGRGGRSLGEHVGGG